MINIPSEWDCLTAHEKAVRSAWNYMQSPNSYSDEERRFVFDLLDQAYQLPPTTNDAPAPAQSGVREAALLEAAQIAWQFSAKAVPPDGPRTMARLIATEITKRAALTSAPAPEDRT